MGRIIKGDVYDIIIFDCGFSQSTLSLRVSPTVTRSTRID
jgi:hypothetical protein